MQRVPGAAGNLCGGAMQYAFTEVDWPINGKRDRGLRLKFDGITLCPGCYIAGSDGSGDNVMLSWTDQNLHSALFSSRSFTS